MCLNTNNGTNTLLLLTNWLQLRKDFTSSGFNCRQWILIQRTGAHVVGILVSYARYCFHAYWIWISEPMPHSRRTMAMFAHRVRSTRQNVCHWSIGSCITDVNSSEVWKHLSTFQMASLLVLASCSAIDVRKHYRHKCRYVLSSQRQPGNLPCLLTDHSEVYHVGDWRGRAHLTRVQTGVSVLNKLHLKHGSWHSDTFSRGTLPRDGHEHASSDIVCNWNSAKFPKTV